jgi:hypothetical protein
MLWKHGTRAASRAMVRLALGFVSGRDAVRRPLGLGNVLDRYAFCVVARIHSAHSRRMRFDQRHVQETDRVLVSFRTPLGNDSSVEPDLVAVFPRLHRLAHNSVCG